MDFCTRREEWVPAAQTLRDGEKRRVMGACGPGNTVMVSSEAGALRAWCFRCGVGDHLPRPVESLQQQAARLARAREQDNDVRRVPTELPQPLLLADRLPEWPMPARLWLYKAGLGGSEIARLGAGYHPLTNRVVLPVLGPSGPVYWQARSIDGRQPKYLGPATGRQQALPRWGEGPVIAVTEDILSAFKIGLAGCAGWCALGTTATPRLLSELMRAGLPVRVWLDPDAAGQSKAQTLIKKLTAYGLDVTNVVSPMDPKLHSKGYIRERLQA